MIGTIIANIINININIIYIERDGCLLPNIRGLT